MAVGGVYAPGTPRSSNDLMWDPKQGRWIDKRQQAREEAERAKYVQAPYQGAAPSAGAASQAATKVVNANPNWDWNVDPTGRASLSNQSEQARKLAEFRAKLDAEAESAADARKLRDRQELMQLLQQSSSPANAATISHSGAGGNDAARAAAFSRAKDQAGALARSSLAAIAEQMAGRGLSGSGIQSLMDAGALDRSAGALVDVTRDQAISDAERADDVADMSYQGGITQRGQDLANRQSYLNLLRTLY